MRLAAAVVAALALAGTSCKVNEYCLNCENGDGGVPGDGGDGDATDGGDGDAPDGGPCINTGNEVCDNVDNDCDGNTDEGILPQVGEACGNNTGECAGGQKMCTNGAIVCSKAPAPEACDGLDNDCNGVVDNGDPGGGAKCGTDVGECVAGTLHCSLVTHMLECVGAIGTVGGQMETCNGRDDDCDGTLDEGLTNLGSCGGGPIPPGDQGLCSFGTLSCIGGGPVCMGDTGPAFEACDNADNDCDGATDEDTNKNGDPLNCGACGNVCMVPHAIAGCAITPPATMPACTVASCQQTFFDVNGVATDGCEYGPCTIQGNEVCNGADDNCNGSVDEGVSPPANFCLQAGACAGATASCQGANGFQCNYGANVSQDANGNIVAETLCDGIDNDCDGNIDEGQPNLGDACTDSGSGVCQGTGTFQCDPLNLNGPAQCVITTPGGTASPEVCDGLDNDCNGVVDNGAATGNLPGQDWISIPNGGGVQIMKWEASRPGANATSAGTNETFVCSKQNALPWTNIKYDQAVAACSSIGARLCTESEWESMCAQPVAPTYPVAGPAGATDHVFIEAEDAFANTGATSGGTFRTWANDTRSNFSGVRNLIATPNTGANLSAANAPAQAPRLDFQINFQQTGNHFVWVRIYAENGNDNSVYVGINAATPGTANGTQLVPNQNQFWQWVVSPAFPIAATGNQFVSVYMKEDGVRVDGVAISRDGVNPPPFDDTIWAFSTNPKQAQPQVCNGNEFDTDLVTAGDQDDTLPTGSRAQCFANGAGAADVFDLSGNVKEWTSARAPGQNPIRGGAANSDVAGLACGLDFTLADDTFFFPNVGFRCCR